MNVFLALTCGGCDATIDVGPLRKRFYGTHGDWGLGSARVDDPESLSPNGWVMFDPFTYATYCPTCWALIMEDDPELIA